MRGLVISPQANADLKQILSVIGASAGRYAAAEFAYRVDRCLSLVAQFPNMTTPRRSLGQNIRSRAIGVYIFVFEVTESATVLLRVVHGRRDIHATSFGSPT